MSNAVLPAAIDAAAQPDHAVDTGVRTCLLIGRDQGSNHLQLQISELDPGAAIRPHLHPHEESIMVLSGSVELWIGGSWHRLERDCFAAVPLGSVHAWRNRGAEVARWFTVRAPLAPYPTEPSMVQINLPDDSFADGVRDAGPVVPWRPTVGRLTPEDLPPFGPLSINGLGHYGAHVRRISVAMAVDRYRGAVHHTLFMVAAPPRPPDPAARPLPHAHPFEEAFLIVEGETEWELAGQPAHAKEGDLVWAGVGTKHGVISATDAPARWIEVQAPAPPPQHGFLFPHEWRELAQTRGAAPHAGLAV